MPKIRRERKLLCFTRFAKLASHSSTVEMKYQLLCLQSYSNLSFLSSNRPTSAKEKAKPRYEVLFFALVAVEFHGNQAVLCMFHTGVPFLQEGAEKSTEKGKKGDKGKDRAKSPPKGKAGKKSPDPSSPKTQSKLRKRGEEDADEKHIGKFFEFVLSFSNNPSLESTED